MMIRKLFVTSALALAFGSFLGDTMVHAQLAPSASQSLTALRPFWLVDSYAEQMSAGGSHTCMVNTCGDVQCWGRNNYGQTSPPLGTFVQVAAGAYHTCGLKTDGTVACWGDNRYNQRVVPSQYRFRSIEAGTYHTCGVSTTGATQCWGYNGDNRATPGGLIASETALDLATGDAHSCAVLSFPWGNDIACWGLDNYGQVNNVPPTQNPIVDEHLAVTAGSRYSCSRSRTGEIHCWGNDSYGQSSGVGFEPSQPNTAWAVEESPGLFLHSGFYDFFDVSAGDWHTCALGDNLGVNNARCWGYNGSGRTSPPVGTFIDVEAGGAHSCGIRDDGTVACWGSNIYGQASTPSLPGTCSLLRPLQTLPTLQLP